MSHVLHNYNQLTARVDGLCSAISEALGPQVTCSAGCSSCCTAITVFPVEAAAMQETLNNLPDKQAEEIRWHVSGHADGERCPLLFHHLCLLYDARPVICRTHGLPIVYEADGQRRGDCCPHNLSDSESLSGINAIDLDKLNTLLVAVNSIYMSQTENTKPEVRVTIADAIKQR